MTTPTPVPEVATAPAATPAAAPAAAAPAPSDVVFIGKIPATSTKADVEAFLATVGPVKRVVMKKYHHTETDQYAFGEYEDPANAAKAIETLNKKKIGEAEVIVEAARNRRRKRNIRKKRKPAAPAAAPAGGAAPAAAENTTGAPAGEKKPRRRRFFRRRRQFTDAPISKDVAYVGNLPFIVDDDGMKDIFEGTKFLEVRVVRRHDKRSKGYGFVTFANEEDRAAAIKVVDGSVVEGRKIRVSPARERVERPKTEEATATPATAAPTNNN